MSNPERRQYNRITFKTPATLMVNGNLHQCQLLDISLHGALATLDTPIVLLTDIEYRLEIPLNGGEERIAMDVILVHQSQSLIGLECQHIDLESVIHLRRLIELNLGDSGLVERDFQALCSTDS